MRKLKRMIQRKMVFETNSSAVHSLTIAKEGMEKSKLPVDADGYIPVEYGEFGKDGVFSTQQDKLSYLVTQCHYLGGWELNINREDNYHFRNVEDAIIDYTGAKGIKIVGGEPDIDHQEQPEYELNLVNEWDKSSIQEFVFNKYISLKCDCD